MPNVSWQEPQILVDVLALSLYADQNQMELPGEREVVVVSPWLSDVEMSLRPSVWHQQMTVGAQERRTSLLDCMRAFLKSGWRVRIAVLAAYTSRPKTLVIFPTTTTSMSPIELFFWVDSKEPNLR